MHILNKYKDEIPPGAVNVMRPNILGNPMVIGKDGTRDEVIDKFEIYLKTKIEASDNKIINAMKALNTDSKLLCCCKPSRCHAEVIAKLWYQYFNKPDYHPRDDGTTHINIYSRGRTQLGKMLSNFADIPLQHPDYGYFRTVEGFWHWLKTGKQHDLFRNCNGFEAKKLSLSTEKVFLDNFQQEIKKGLLLKITQHPQLSQLLQQSTLPLVHYYYYGDIYNAKVQPVKNAEIITDYISLVRDYLNGKAHILIIAGSRGIIDYELIKRLYFQLGIKVVKFISGHALKGVDPLGERLAKELHLPLDLYPAQWEVCGRVNRAAGHERNYEMAKSDATFLLSVWDGKSPGTRNMVSCMEREGKPYQLWRVTDEGAATTELVNKSV